MNENFTFLTLKMDSLAEKMTARDVYFSAQGVEDLFPDPLNPSFTDVLELQFH